MEKTFQPFLLIVNGDHVIRINYFPAQVTQIQVEFYAPSFAKAKRQYPAWFSSQPKFQYFELETVSRKPISLEGFEEHIQNGELIQFWCEELEDYLDFSELNLQILIQMLFEYFSLKESEEYVDIMVLHARLVEKDNALMSDSFSDAPFGDQVDEGLGDVDLVDWLKEAGEEEEDQEV